MDGDRFSSLTDVAVSRRGAMAVGGAALGSTFALSVQPVCAQTMITTSTDGLTAGVVKVKTKDGKEMDAYRAMPATGQGFGTILVVPEIWGVHATSPTSAGASPRQGITPLRPSSTSARAIPR
jgi:carboxymethylenebutenolidase